MPQNLAKDHDLKRQHILAAAARVFAEEGVSRASMAQVAKACGISKANIYHYYDRKDALLFGILENYLRTLRDRLAALPDAPPEHAFRMFLRETLLAYDGMDAEHKIQTEGLPLLPVSEQDVLKGYQRDMVAQLSGLLARLQPDIAQEPRALRTATMSVFGMLNWFYMWNQSADADARLAYADHVAMLTLGGLPGLRSAENASEKDEVVF